jgi:hypothetical protein
MKMLVAASGPSLKIEDLEYAKDKVSLSIAVNDAHLLMPWANIIYSSADDWWERFYSDILNGNLHFEHCPLLLDKDSANIEIGDNSGFAAIRLAERLGATQIYLLGFDMGFKKGGPRHFFGDHKGKLDRDSPYEKMKQTMATTVWEAEIINCTDGGYLECFPRKHISRAL